MRASSSEVQNFVIVLSIVIVIFIFIASPSRVLAQETITGAVRNQTLGNAAAGDEVILLSPNQGMREETRTKTDARGSFRLTARSPHQPYLVRVIHQGVNYDERASSGEAVSINVYDAAEKVRGLTGTIEIIRAETRQNQLHVSDMVEISNTSQPPITQAGRHSFETWLPTNARVDSVFAAGSGGSAGKAAVLISAEPVVGQPGHYTVNFPLRPGITKFALNYDIPYDGRAAFLPHLEYSVQQLAVMIPLTMKFTARAASNFVLLPTQDKGYQVHAATEIKRGTGPAFEISGAGTLPEVRAQNQPAAKPPVKFHNDPAPSTPRNHEATNPNPVAASRTPEPQQLNSWVLIAVAVIVLGFCGFVLRRPHQSIDVTHRRSPAASHLSQPSKVYAKVLKDEMLQLEIDRSRGTISGEEYNSVRCALERTAKRAASRAEVRS